jgi:Ras-related protein Rab-8A
MTQAKSSNYDYLIKLIIIGDSGTGKSSLLLRFCDNLFNTTFISTIGIDFKIRTMTIDDKKYKLQIWDTAGQERFRTITAAYYRGAMGILLVFDLTNKKTFDSIDYWMSGIQQNASPGVDKILIGNKSDIKDKRQVTQKDTQDLVDKYGIKYIETSAKNNENIEEAFMAIAHMVKNRLIDNHTSLVIKPNNINEDPLQKKCAC